MKTNVDFDYSVGDTVTTRIGVSGVVSSICLDYGGEVYGVNWLNSSGAVKHRWFRTSEIIGETVTE